MQDKLLICPILGKLTICPTAPHSPPDDLIYFIKILLICQDFFKMICFSL